MSGHKFHHVSCTFGMMSTAFGPVLPARSHPFHTSLPRHAQMSRFWRKIHDTLIFSGCSVLLRPHAHADPQHPRLISRERMGPLATCTRRSLIQYAYCAAISQLVTKQIRKTTSDFALHENEKCPKVSLHVHDKLTRYSYMSMRMSNTYA